MLKKIPERTIYISLILCACLICGCSGLAKMVVGQKGLEIPQIVAHLEPSFKDNYINISGKIVIQNPTESALDMDRISLEIRDENKDILAQDVLDWEKPSVTSGAELEAPVAIKLGLPALKNKSIVVWIHTGFTYKKFNLHIPIESRVAVLHLEALKETITRPLNINIFTKLRSTIAGDSSVDFVLSLTNPLSIDLSLEEVEIFILTLDGKEIAKSILPATFFKGSQSNQINGSIRIGNIWGKLIRGESARGKPLKFQLSGKLVMPGTDISMPFRIESVVEINFSLF